MKLRRPTWLQPTPSLELRALCSNLEGHFANWSEGVTDSAKFSKAFTEIMADIKEVSAHVERTGRSDAW